MRARSMAVTVLAVCALAQAQAAAPAYVATIKASGTGPMKMIGVRNLPDGIHAENASLATLIRYANGYMKFPSDDRVTGVPDWAKTAKFDIDAKMSEADAAEMQRLTKDEQDEKRQRMEQALLVDRFKLNSHRETKQLPVYELVLSGDLKLKPTDEAVMNAQAAASGRPPARSTMGMGRGSMTAKGYTMEGLAGFLSSPVSRLERPVVDKTGLAGRYDFTLNWMPSGVVTVNGVPQGSELSVFTALEDLGLKLRPATGAVDVIVIDSVEKPSEN